MLFGTFSFLSNYFPFFLSFFFNSFVHLKLNSFCWYTKFIHIRYRIMLPSSNPHLTTANHINISVDVMPSIRKTNSTKNYAMTKIIENNKYFDACRGKKATLLSCMQQLLFFLCNNFDVQVIISFFPSSTLDEYVTNYIKIFLCKRIKKGK